MMATKTRTKKPTIAQILARWDSGEGKPYKGQLIDWRAYGGNGDAPPSDIGCMCAQGQMLHLLGGWSPKRLHEIAQAEADKAAAKLLKISVAHAILLRNINDSVDGAPSIVLTHPEKILGDQAHIVLAFWRHLDRMTGKDWIEVQAARAAARAAAGAAAGACSEIQGAALMRKRDKPFFFLPMFGFADPEAVLAADQPA